MDWWTDLWLNEGFATYVSAVATQHIRPEWHSVSRQVMHSMSSSSDTDIKITLLVLSSRLATTGISFLHYFTVPGAGNRLLTVLSTDFELAPKISVAPFNSNELI